MNEPRDEKKKDDDKIVFTIDVGHDKPIGYKPRKKKQETAKEVNVNES